MCERINEALPPGNHPDNDGESSYHDDDVMLRKLANAKVDFLQTPFLPYDLAEKVRTVLERVS